MKWRAIAVVAVGAALALAIAAVALSGRGGRHDAPAGVTPAAPLGAVKALTRTVHPRTTQPAAPSRSADDQAGDRTGDARDDQAGDSGTGDGSDDQAGDSGTGDGRDDQAGDDRAGGD